MLSLADQELMERAFEALVWCSCTARFGEDGQAEWKALVKPTIDDLWARLRPETEHVSKADAKR